VAAQEAASLRYVVNILENKALRKYNAHANSELQYIVESHRFYY
jgi:hypothetical protein